MRKLKLLLTGILVSLIASSQAGQINQINIVNFTVKNVLPGTVDNWLSTPGALVLTAQKVPGTQVREPMMVLQIRSNGAIVCGNSMASPKRIDPFDVRVFSTADLLGLLGNCNELKPGNYTLCVQFFNIDKVAISREVCKDFRVEDTNIDYAPPTLITPDNGKKFSLTDLMKPLQFRWTPLVPKPREPVTYRLRVWQLMQGQNGNAAMRSNTPIADKEVKEITQATLTNILTGPCRPPYLCDFIWNVQALNREGKPMGKNNGMSEAWTFSAAQPDEISPPQNVLPENNKRLTVEEAQREVKFQWTAVAPKQIEPVTYKLRVWQLMQGQNGTQAMKANKPLIEKELRDITQTNVSGLLTGPCKPPYLCDFIWNVQALNREGKPLGSNNGTSEPTMFFASQYIIQLDSIKVVCTSTPGVYSFSYTLSNVNPGTATLTNFAITSSVPAGATMGPFAPPIGTSIASGNQLTVTGTINAAPNLSNICIGAEITDAVNSFWKASKDTCTPVVPCKCDVCDSVKIEVNPKDEIKLDAAGNLIQNNTITISPKPVKSVKAELVYFEYKPESDDCMICNKDSKTYGNFINASAGLVSPTIPFGHTVNWVPNGQTVTSQPLSFTISMPPTVKCCAAEVKLCIRYVVTFMDCTVCNKLVCYSYNKKCDCK
ncbi:MAG: hypothetical protein JNM19_06825 [Chitinophagaceae bacterium]|nr:hypothetical protein [Chitinophagaceae bacterium]